MRPERRALPPSAGEELFSLSVVSELLWVVELAVVFSVAVVPAVVDGVVVGSVSLWVVVAVVASVGAVVGLVTSVREVYSVIFPLESSDTFPLPKQPVRTTVSRRTVHKRAITFLMIFLHLFCVAGIVLHSFVKLNDGNIKWRKIVAVFC